MLNIFYMLLFIYSYLITVSHLNTTRIQIPNIVSNMISIISVQRMVLEDASAKNRGDKFLGTILVTLVTLQNLALPPSFWH